MLVFTTISLHVMSCLHFFIFAQQLEKNLVRESCEFVPHALSTLHSLSIALTFLNDPPTSDSTPDLNWGTEVVGGYYFESLHAVFLSMTLQKGLEVDTNHPAEMVFDLGLSGLSLSIICQLIAGLVVSTQGQQSGRIAFREKIEQIEEDMEEVRWFLPPYPLHCSVWAHSQWTQLIAFLLAARPSTRSPVQSAKILRLPLDPPEATRRARPDAAIQRYESLVDPPQGYCASCCQELLSHPRGAHRRRRGQST